MAGTLIVSNLKTDTDNSFIVRSNTGTTLFVANTTGIDVANSFASGSITSDKILTLANTKISGNIISSQITSVANTQISGNIISSQITSVGGSQITANTIANSAIQTGAVENYMNAAGLGFGMRNRIINGAMVIDQRNAGASFTPTSGNYGLDRYRYFVSQASKITAQQSSTVPTGFSTSFLQTVATAVTPGSSDYFVFQQNIEGYNIADMQFGTASAATFTVSFWVRSSVTGIYSVYLANASVNRTYLANYTVIAANTWEQKTITITGDTTGTWGNTNSGGIMIGWDLGSGSTYNGTANTWQAGQYYRTSSSVNWISTASATFYITGVQLEKGSTATSFDYLDYGRSLIQCQRYYQMSGYDISGRAESATLANVVGKYIVEMRAAPSLTVLNGSSALVTFGVSTYTISSLGTLDNGTNGYRQAFNTSGMVAGNVVNGYNKNTLGWSAEL